MNKLVFVLVVCYLFAVSDVFSAWPNGPLKALYIDIGINWSDPGSTYKSIADAGYNYIILAFLVSGKSYDAVAGWEQISNKTAVIDYIHSKGAKVAVSAGGSTDLPYNSISGKDYGTTVAKWAVANQVDGVDFDLENFGNGFTGGSLSSQQTIQWVVDATNAARQIIGQNGIISHAPQPPYFGTKYPYNDGYGQVYKNAPSIDFLLIQFYNNGPSGTFSSIFTSDDGASVQEIHQNEGIPYQKLIVGKPATGSDAGGGYVDPATLHSFFVQANNTLGWNSGVMFWQWHDYNSAKALITQVYP